jgi:hypothetical protein
VQFSVDYPYHMIPKALIVWDGFINQGGASLHSDGDRLGLYRQSHLLLKQLAVPLVARECIWPSRR